MRRRRLDIAGIPLHITHRGVDRADVFFEPADRQEYLLALAHGLEAGNVHLHGYVLMRNHVHLLATPREAGAVSRLIQCVGRRYVRRVNLRRSRTGTLWEGRFKSFPVDTDRYLLNCLAYIELNPVRAGLVPRADQFEWSSVHHHLARRREPWLREHTVFTALGADAGTRASAWRALLDESIRRDVVTDIRRHTQVERPWGTEGFTRELERLTGLYLRVRGPGRPPTDD